MKKAKEFDAKPSLPATMDADCHPAPAGKILETATSAELERRSPTDARGEQNPMRRAHMGARDAARRLDSPSAGVGAKAYAV